MILSQFTLSINDKLLKSFMGFILSYHECVVDGWLFHNAMFYISMLQTIVYIKFQ